MPHGLMNNTNTHFMNRIDGLKDKGGMFMPSLNNY